MFDWLLRLFDTAGFAPRWRCGDWSATLGWTHVAADVATWVAYLGIPAVILFYVRRRADLALKPVCWLFALFVAFCGFGHSSSTAFRASTRGSRWCCRARPVSTTASCLWRPAGPWAMPSST
jgi:hypothetical protein